MKTADKYLLGRSKSWTKKGHFNHYFYSFHKTDTFTPMGLNECMKVQGTCHYSIANSSGFDL